jgi:hypothetical protein
MLRGIAIVRLTGSFGTVVKITGRGRTDGSVVHYLSNNNNLLGPAHRDYRIGSRQGFFFFHCNWQNDRILLVREQQTTMAVDGY